MISAHIRFKTEHTKYSSFTLLYLAFWGGHDAGVFMVRWCYHAGISEIGR